MMEETGGPLIREIRREDLTDDFFDLPFFLGRNLRPERRALRSTLYSVYLYEVC